MEALARAAMVLTGPVPVHLPNTKIPLVRGSPDAQIDIASIKRQAEEDCNANRAERVNQAMRASGLIKREGKFSFRTFEIPFSEVRDSEPLRMAGEEARKYLITPSDLEAAPAVVDAKVLNTHVIAMANLLPALAKLEGRRYTEQQKSDWRAIVGNLWTSLKSQHGQVYDASSMPSQVRQVLTYRMRDQGYDLDSMSIFAKNAYGGAANDLARDLNSLLDHVAAQCAREFAKREETKAVLRQRRLGFRTSTVLEIDGNLLADKSMLGGFTFW